ATCVIMMIDMFLTPARRIVTYWLSLATLIVCGAMAFSDYSAGTTSYAFSNSFVSDPMANLLKVFACVAVGLTLIYSRQYTEQRDMLKGELGGEFYMLALF